MPSQLGIIGAGPKAAAIAAKAAALRQAGLAAPQITIIEAVSPGAAWHGKGGYSDGISLLCTLAERDVGFPYDRATFGAGVAKEAFATFSWQAFLIDRGTYAEWISRGRRRPTHRHFSEYLEWVIERSGADLVFETVVGLQFDPASTTWTIRTATGPPLTGFDGIVVTGSGPALPPLPGTPPSVLNGQDFWRRTNEVEQLLRDEEAAISIIGAGGTAAAVAAWFVRNGFGALPIRIVGREATLFSRSPGFFEEAVFGDDARWASMTDEHRDTFLRRLTAGVVWEDIVDILAGAPGVSYMPGDVVAIEDRDSELVIRIAGSPEILQPASVVVDCRGFDAWWFRGLLPAAASAVVASWKGARQGQFDEALSLAGGFPYAGLHVPGLAFKQGPAASNLMALGWMADRILRPYCDDQELLRLL